MEIVHKTDIAQEWVELAKQLKTHPANAKACWEAWCETKITNFGVPEKGLNAFQNRLLHFSSKTGLPSGKAVSFCRIFAVREQQLTPEIKTQGIPGGSAAVPLSSLAKSKVLEVEPEPVVQVVEDTERTNRRKRRTAEVPTSNEDSTQVE